MDKDEIRKIIGIETTYPNGATIHPPRGFYTVGQLCDALKNYHKMLKFGHLVILGAERLLPYDTIQMIHLVLVDKDL